MSTSSTAQALTFPTGDINHDPETDEVYEEKVREDCMCDHRRRATTLTPYQEAIRLAASIELERGIHSAWVAIREPERQKASTYDAQIAYQEALSTLSHSNIPISDSMVLDKITHLRQLLQRVGPQFDEAAA